MLLSLVRAGDESARNRLLSRYLPLLRLWAHGRLPSRARGMVDTDDLVQTTLIKALDRVHAFEPRREGAFLAYLRRIVLNHVRDELRRVARNPGQRDLPPTLADLGPSPVEEVIGLETLERYERALATLSEEQQEAVVLRVEMGFTHQMVAEVLQCPSVDAARMIVTRALVRLAEEMKRSAPQA